MVSPIRMNVLKNTNMVLNIDTQFNIIDYKYYQTYNSNLRYFLVKTKIVLSDTSSEGHPPLSRVFSTALLQ